MGGDTPGLVILGYSRKQAMGERFISSILPWVPALTSLSDGL